METRLSHGIAWEKLISLCADGRQPSAVFPRQLYSEVSERVDLCDVVGAVRCMSVAVGGKHLHRAVAPFVIGISRHDRARSVIDADNIALRIVGKVIGRRRGLCFGRIVVIVKPIYIAAAVQQEHQILAVRAVHSDHLPVGAVNFSRHAARGLRKPHAVFIVGIACGYAVFRDALQLSAFCPSKGHAVPVLQRIADFVIGNGLSVETCQQIRPGAVGIPIGFHGFAVLRDRSYVAVLIAVFGL